MAVDDLVPANIEALFPYEPGKPIEELERELGISGAIKLASNENPLGPSPLGVAAAREALLGSSRYPDGGGFRLRRAIAERIGVTMDHVILGAGSNEIIDNLVRTFCRPGIDEVLTHRYAFMMYRVSCGAHGVTYRESEVTAELGCDLDALLAAVSPKTKLVFLPNPNNPTGTYVRRAELERLCTALPAHVLLVVDEAYFEYARVRPDYPDATTLLAARPRMMVLRTFSKAYGLAALRVGYGIADARIIGYLNRVRMPFNVATPAQEAARAALTDDEHVARSVRVTAEGIAQLAAGLSRLPVKLYDSAGNFVLVDLGRDVGPVYEALLRRGVIVRSLRMLGMARHVRITVGTHAENERVIAALADVLASGT
jgi:histidinol-phosphate aminotransferase